MHLHGVSILMLDLGHHRGSIVIYDHCYFPYSSEIPEQVMTPFGSTTVR